MQYITQWIQRVKRTIWVRVAHGRQRDMFNTNFWTVCKIQKRATSKANWSNVLSGGCFFFSSPKFTVHAEIFRQHYRPIRSIAHFFFIFLADTFSLQNESLNINTGFESHQSECFEREWIAFHGRYSILCMRTAVFTVLSLCVCVCVCKHSCFAFIC